MNWIKSILPTIGGLLGGPLGSMAAEKVAKVLNLQDSSKDTVERALSSTSLTPEQVAALQAADVEIKLKLAELGVESEKIMAMDRDSARKMQMQMGSHVPAILAGVITLGFFGILVGLQTGWLKLWDHAGLQMLLGSLGTSWGMVVSYYFGSAHQQEKK